MKLSELLKGKSAEILKIDDNACIADAASLLTEQKIGALLVNGDDGEIVGILSERDIVRGMGLHGANLKDVAVSSLMTGDIIRCSGNDTVNKAMAMMTDRHIRHLPVFEDGNLLGVISIGDLVKCRILEVQTEAEAMRQYILS